MAASVDKHLYSVSQPLQDSVDTTHHTPVGEAEPSRHADPSSALEVEASCRNDALRNMPVCEILILAPVRN